MSSTGKKLTDKKCKKCNANLEMWWAEDIGGYSCPGCGARFSIEDYWEKDEKNSSVKKVIVDRRTNEVVGGIFLICNGCGRVLGQDQKGNCPSCGGELEEKGIIDGVEESGKIFVARNIK